jgi:hypothetical protein
MRPMFRLTALTVFLVTPACTGLRAGPEVSAAGPVPASRDSAYVRVRRALTAEAFTLDVVDSLGGHITGTRYPSANAKLGSAQSCRVVLALDVRGGADSAKLATTSRWLAPEAMADSATKVCEQERADVLDRIQLTVAPAATP